MDNENDLALKMVVPDKDDILIAQKNNVLQAIRGAGAEGKITVITVGKIVNEAFSFGEFLDRMPHPRLDNLMLLACRTALGKAGSQEKAGNYLGITRRQIALKLGKEDDKIK